MGKVSTRKRVAESPRWKTSQYVYKASRTLVFQLCVDTRFPSAHAFVGNALNDDFHAYRVGQAIDLSLTEASLSIECERLAGQYAGVATMLAFVAGLSQEASGRLQDRHDRALNEWTDEGREVSRG